MDFPLQLMVLAHNLSTVSLPKVLIKNSNEPAKTRQKCYTGQIVCAHPQRKV